MNKTFTLVTPARNESLHILRLIECVKTQTIQPAKWVIIDDNSTDGTYDIAVEASKLYEKLNVIRLTHGTQRSFGSKANAFKQGYEYLKNIAFDYVGNLDADVTFGPQYYERIIEEMTKNQNLGVASGVVYDKTTSGYKRTISSLNHAVGAVQFWRKACFEEIGGYKPVTLGGVDSLAERTARMNGWETRSFPDLAVYHHKPVDSANGRSGLRIAYRAGLTEYHIGTHPLFAVLKAIRHWKESPPLVSAIVRMFAYGKLWISGTQRDASAELVAFLKNEQIALIRQTLLNVWKG